MLLARPSTWLERMDWCRVCVVPGAIWAAVRLDGNVPFIKPGALRCLRPTVNTTIY